MSNQRRSRRRRQPPSHLVPDDPVPSLPAKKSKQSSSSSKPATTQPVPLPSPPSSATSTSTYSPCHQTLFLADDNVTFSWAPVQSTQKGAINIQRYLVPFKNDVHAYFKSSAAAKNAAVSIGAISIYRHIGHVTLRKFQQLNGLESYEQWFPTVKKMSNPYVNLRIPIESSWCENDHLSTALESLCSVQEELWPKPYIVALAERDHVIRACDVDNFDEDFDLNVQIFAGRLLFELIACPDIHQLFNSLKSPAPFSPVPTVPEYLSVFSRSPINRQDEFNSYSFYNILRLAESTGYADLAEEHRKKIEIGLTVQLYDYQQHTVRWMIDKENGPHTLNDYFWEERSFSDTHLAPGGKYYYFPLTGEVRLYRPPRTRGGMVTEEMGLGKTVEALALILAQKCEYKAVEVDIWCEKSPSDVRVVNSVVRLSRLRNRNQEKEMSHSIGFQHGDEILEDADEVEFPGNVKVLRWPAKTTLIVCPKSLLGQWKLEITKRAPSLTLFEWPTSKSTCDLQHHAVGAAAKDVVLATYDMVRNDATLSKICWKRLILDEAQVTRRSAAQVAKDVFNLRSETRFLMTGTPFVTSVNDLKGQLTFLKVWPFTLEEDGFWETHILRQHHGGSGLNLLKALLKVTMIRHSKGQRLNVSLTNRTYETIKVDLTYSYRACYYYVLASCLDDIDSQSPFHIDTRRLRTLLKILLALCLSPYLLDAVTLDLSRRFTWSRRPAAELSNAVRSIRKVTPQEAIQFVAESGSGVLRDSQRVFALGNHGSGNALERFMEMSLDELRRVVIGQNLLPESRALRTQRDRLVVLAAGGPHRLTTDTITDLRRTAIDLGIAPQSDVMTWSRAKAIARLRLHFDLENGIQTLRSVHESGFAAIMKLIENRGNPGCPVCLTDCDSRVTVTKCGHLYCLDCVMMLLGSGTTAGRRCAICRRDLSPDLTVEIKRQGDEETAKEAKKEENVSSLLESGSDLTTAGALQSMGIAEEVVGEVRNGNGSNGISPDGTDSETVGAVRMSAQDIWRKFERCDAPPQAFNSIGRNERFPSLCPEFLRHLSVVRSDRTAPPKMAALLNLIQSSDKNVKFCVVAGYVESLRVISRFLKSEGIECVGAGIGNRADDRQESGQSATKPLMEAAERFSSDPNVRVYLLNPTNAAGLTLTVASVVVFMETLMRVADEIQAAARVHRIGQTKDVKIVRIVARNTIEERIVDRRRRELSNPEEETRALAVSSSGEASDGMILQLFGLGEAIEIDTESDSSRDVNAANTD